MSSRVTSALIGLIVAAMIIGGVWAIANRHSSKGSNDSGLNPSVLQDFQPRLTIDGKITAKIISDQEVVAKVPRLADGKCGSAKRYGTALQPPPGAVMPKITLAVDSKTCDVVATITHRLK